MMNGDDVSRTNGEGVKMNFAAERKNADAPGNNGNDGYSNSGV
jgi:hypothetical protein